MNDDKPSKLLKMFEDGTGFGDADARRQAEVELLVALAMRQEKTAKVLNRITYYLVAVGLVQAIVAVVQLLR